MVVRDETKFPTDAKNGKVKAKQPPKGWGYRHQQCVILFFCLATSYCIRTSISVALVAMAPHPSVNISSSIVNTTTNDTQNILLNATVDTQPNSFLHSLMLVKPYPSFNWSKKTQDIILSSFFWGYLFLQVPAGMLAHRFGTRYLLLCSMILNSILFITLPWAAYYGGWVCVAIFRFLQGLFQACLMPSSHTFFEKWTPLQERSRLTAIVFGGQALGPVLGFPLTGFIASSAMGWPGIFRFYGFLCAIFAGLLWWFLADCPAQHPRISNEEREYIEDELGEREILPVPWGAILKSRGLWAMIISHIGHAFGHVILYTEVPSYMENVLKVNIKANGLLTAFPFLGMFVMNFVYSYFADMIINKKWLSVTNTRKLFNTFASVMGTIGLIALCFAPKQVYVAETILVLLSSCVVGGNVGYHVINVDMTPNFAGTLMSLSNFCATVVVSFAPIGSAYLIPDAQNPHQWCRLFFLAAAMIFLSNLVFIYLGTAEKQKYNQPQPKEIEQSPESVPMIEANIVKVKETS